MFVTGDTNRVREQRARVFEAFIEDLKLVSGQQKLLLVLDTAERLVYKKTPSATEQIQFAESWHWLTSVISRISNMVILIAGRPEAESLRQHLHTILPGNMSDVPVEPFTEKESLEYFDAVARLATHKNEPGLTRRINALSADYRRLAHRASGGQPILLALLVDYLSLGSPGQVPDMLRDQTILNKPEEELAAIRAGFEEQLINRLIETPGISETVKALGRVPKGADPDLLAGLIGVPISDAHQRLAEVKQLSFVKVRDQKVFLHDEMYRLLHTYIYDSPFDEPEAARALEIIIQNYRDRLERHQQELNELYAPVEVEGKERLDRFALARLSDIQQAYIIEIIYYQLRQNAVWGFQHYFRAAKDASSSNNTALDAQLEAEVVTFLQERDPEGQHAVVDDLERRLVLSVTILRPAIRAFIDQQPEKFLETARHLRQRMEPLIAADPTTDVLSIAEAALSVWEGYAMTFLGDEESMHKAQDAFDGAIERIDQFLAAIPDNTIQSENRRWRAKFALAFAYRIRGYFQRVRGLLPDSIEDYRNAARLWREMKMENELATTLNNLGFALSGMGRREDARSLVEEGLNLRRKRGSRSLVGLSLNTLALVRLRDGAYSNAIDLAERALTLFRALNDRRGTGLALIALSDALRRSNEGTLMITVEDQIRNLRDACDCAQEAWDIFEQTGERERQIEALINQGCAYRDWATIRRVYPHARENVARLAARSEDSLRRAIDIAGDEWLYRRVDALINLGWLGLYTEVPELFEEAIASAEAAIPAEYRFSKEHGHPLAMCDHGQLLLWPQLGKLHVLYGHRIFHRYRVVENAEPIDPHALAKIALHYTLGLQYNELHGSDFPGLRAARDQVYGWLKYLDIQQLNAIAHQVQQVESEFHLDNSALRQLLENRALWYV
jgi:tetratricopeptide (TPR) repeat protein